jgi:hypothetical protein
MPAMSPPISVEPLSTAATIRTVASVSAIATRLTRALPLAGDAGARSLARAVVGRRGLTDIAVR